MRASLWNSWQPLQRSSGTWRNAEGRTKSVNCHGCRCPLLHPVQTRHSWTAAVLTWATRWCTLFFACLPRKSIQDYAWIWGCKTNKNKKENRNSKDKNQGDLFKTLVFYTLNSFFFSLMQIMLRWRTSVVFSLLHSSKIIPNIWAGPKPMSDSLAIPGNLLLNFILQCWRRYK